MCGSAQSRITPYVSANPIKLDPEKREQQEGGSSSPGGKTEIVQGASGPVRSPAIAPVAADALSTRPHFPAQRLQTTCLVLLTAGALLIGLYFAKLPLIVTMISILLAFVLAPIVDLLLKWRIPRSVGAMVAVLLMCSALYGLVYMSYNNALEFAQQMPRYSGEIRHLVVRFRQNAEKLEKTTQNVLPAADDDKQTLRVRQEKSWADSFTENLGTLSETALIISFIPFLVYFMLSWQEHARTASVLLFRRENRNTAYVTLGLISSMIRSFIVGNFVVGLFIGVVSTIVFALLNVPYFYFVGFISGFLSLVPYLGVLLALAPPLVTAMGHVHGAGLLGIVITVCGLHLFALNVLYPKFLGSRLQLNPLAVTLALLFWGSIWGATGLVLAIPLTAGIKIVLDHIEPLRSYGAWLGE
jgi:predicted PurR-regulated permease PerM